MAGWPTGAQAVAFLIERGRLELLGETDLPSAASAAIERATKRIATARAALDGDDIDGAYAAAYDAYRMAADALLVRQGLLATGGQGSHVTVEDAVSAQFAGRIAEYAKATFERFRKTRHTAQYFDPSAAPLERADAEWAIEVSRAAVDAASALLRSESIERFEGEG
jgi:uncharacterized protein (UPF0332 family)